MSGLLYVWLGERVDFLGEYRKLNWAPFVLGAVIVGLEAGWIYAYSGFHKMLPGSWNGPWLVSCYVVEGVLVALTLWSLHTYTGAYMPYLRRALGRDDD